MKSLRLLMFGVLAAALLAVPSIPLTLDSWQNRGSAAAKESIDIEYFYEELAPYGQWVWHPQYSYVWLPQSVSEDWRPYSVGHWLYTDDYGWYWYSEEPFAWAVYHYGRWGYDPDYGWFWVPGDLWAPAWVTWRYGDSHVGWAPIAPRRAGYAYGPPAIYEPPVAEAWVFVEPDYLLFHDVCDYAVPVPQIHIVFLQTTIIQHLEVHGDLVYNAGFPYQRLAGFLPEPIPSYHLVEVQAPGAARWDYRAKELSVFAPRLKRQVPQRPPKHFAKAPFEAGPKAKLRSALGAAPKGIGPSASKLKPIAREVGPEAFTDGPAAGLGTKGPQAAGKQRRPETAARPGPKPPKAAGKQRGPDRGALAAKPKELKAVGKARAADRGAAARPGPKPPKAAGKQRGPDRGALAAKPKEPKAVGKARSSERKAAGQRPKSQKAVGKQRRPDRAALAAKPKEPKAVGKAAGGDRKAAGQRPKPQKAAGKQRGPDRAAQGPRTKGRETGGKTGSQRPS